MKKASIHKLGNRRMVNPLPVRQKVSGLCSCCSSLKTCTYSKDSHRPILQCEEFDGIVPYSLKMLSHRRSVPRGLEKTPTPGMSEPVSHRGLCNLCEDHLMCTYPKPEGGVWHCEEYR